MNKILYLFTGGRIEKLSNKEYSKEFFYGYDFLKTKNLDVEIIEFKKNSFVLNKLEHLISKFTSLPMYIFSFLSFQNIKKIKNSNNLVMISESCGFATLPFLILYKKKFDIKTHLFVMGLFSKKINYNIFKRVHNSLIDFLLSYIDHMYILGKKEYELALKRKSNCSVHFTPFYVDNTFWDSRNIDFKANKQILFVGNDSNRDFELLIKIAKEMTDYNFVFVTSNKIILNEKKNLKNVELIKGNWNNSLITDSQLLKIYSDSKLVILPLKNSTQPSGQSVAMQAMSVGLPVIISETDGFWDKKNFINNENILFVKSNSLIEWVHCIKNIYSDRATLQKISKNGKDMIDEKFNFSQFNKFILGQVNK